MRTAGARWTRTNGRAWSTCMPHIAAERGAVELVAPLEELPASVIDVAADLRRGVAELRPTPTS